MFLVKSVLIFFILTGLQTNGEDSSDISIRDLPLEIIKDLVKILTNTLTLVGHCGPSQANNLTLGLHTRTDPATPISLNLTNPQEIQKGKKTILIAHGYLSNPNQASFQNMKNKYLTKYDCNLLLLDWSNITFQSYNSVYCQIPHVADRLADFFCLLEKSYGIALRDLHLVGHSLGAQLSGKIGQLTKAKCNRSVGRITGLDPAGPQFYGFSKSHRLDKDDADFVDVIHTNRGVFGYYGNCGDSDFYVNCGADQPGCLVVNVTEIMKTSLSVVTCSHSRSHELFAESILSTDFIGRHCSFCIPQLFCNRHYVVMGENAEKDENEDDFWVPTKKSSPFAIGCSPFPGLTCT